MNALTRQLTEQDLVEARILALFYHANDMYGDLPYSFHLDQVLAMTQELGLSIEYQITALLHDVIEDHGVTRQTIAEKFGDFVADLVWAVSGIGKNRRERKVDTLVKLGRFPKAIILKMIDRYCNFKHAIETKNWPLITMYLKEMPDYADLFQTEPEFWARMRMLIVEAASALANK